DEISTVGDEYNSTIIDANDVAEQNATNSHKGCHIDEITYSPSCNFFVTHSRDDSSIVGWSIDLDKGTIQKDKYFKYSEEDFEDILVKMSIKDVSDNKYVILYNIYGYCSKQSLIN